MSNKGTAAQPKKEGEKRQKAAARPPEEIAKEKRAAFEKIFGPRVSKALATISLLKKGANTRSYNFSATDIKQMTDALSDAVDGVQKAYDVALAGGTSSAEKPQFKFGS